MHRLWMLAATSLVAALALGATAAPAAAADKGKLTVVNGMPGTRIDVCIGSSNEIKSGLGYGASFRKQLLGSKKLRFRKAAPGKCKGKLLAARTVGLPSGSDKTVVFSKKSPKVLVFDNDRVDQVNPNPVGVLATRHAADLSWNAVHIDYQLWQQGPGGSLPPTLADDDPVSYEKGEARSQTLALSAYRMQVLVKRPAGTPVLRESDIFEVKELRRHEFYFIGTTAANSKLVHIVRALAEAPSAP
jgi:hypothetical protein